jgi:hypothetical protein
MSPSIRLALSILLVAGACGGPGTSDEPHQITPPPSDPTFTLYVSNQSFDLDPVDIDVEIDGALQVTGDFRVEGQHTWVKFDFDLAPGSHAITARTVAGDVVHDETFAMDDRKWAVINFWYYAAGSPEPTPPQFSWTLLDEPPAFQ